jgi:hypothetical protein
MTGVHTEQEALLTIAAAWVIGALFWVALRADDRPRSWILWLAMPVLAALPFAVSARHRVWRAIVAIACVTQWLKMYDLHYGRTQGARRPSFGKYILFHLNPCALVARRLVDAPYPTLGDNLRRLVRGASSVAVGASVLQRVFRASRSGAWPFLAEHSVKAVLAFLVVYGGFEILNAVWRLSGFRAPTVMLRFFLARTPAEFWRLYNRQVSQFFAEDVIEPLYPALGPGGATLAAFLMSGVLHEYVAFMAIGKIQFLMTAFFMLQGVGVVVTYRVRPTGAAAVIGVAATLAFEIATSVLWFANVNQLLPWYSRAPFHWIL